MSEQERAVRMNPSHLNDAAKPMYDLLNGSFWALENSGNAYFQHDFRERVLRVLALAHGNEAMRVSSWNYPDGDDEWLERIITEVETGKDGKIDCIASEMGTIGWRDGATVTPKEGDLVRYYGRGFGSPVRGLFVNGERIWYWSEAEYREKTRLESEERDAKRREEFEREGKPRLDAEYDRLPVVFQRRIDRFRTNNPDFRWEYEDYEMLCCTEAVKIADALGTPDAVKAFHDMPWDQQQAKVSGLSDQHSGNTFGCACSLAYWYLKDPAVVVGRHGALTVLAGAEKYGDVPRTDVPA